jgi:hypothetical protein
MGAAMTWTQLQTGFGFLLLGAAATLGLAGLITWMFPLKTTGERDDG